MQTYVFIHSLSRWHTHQIVGVYLIIEYNTFSNQLQVENMHTHTHQVYKVLLLCSSVSAAYFVNIRVMPTYW